MRSHNHPSTPQAPRGKRAKRALLVLLAAVCCFLPVLVPRTAEPMQAEAASSLPDAAYQVRVGVAVPALGSGLYTAILQCESGFTAGVSTADGRGFEGLFPLHTASLKVTTDNAGTLSLLDGESGELLYTYVSERPFALKGANGAPIRLHINGGQREYPGFLEIVGAGGALQVVNVVERETYVKCVMSTEIGSNVSRETRRAFSVMIRTVPMTPKHTANGCDVCGTNCCQVYRGNYLRDPENDAIVDSTKGEYITYQGVPIQCLYHGGNGGASCSSVAAWGGDEVPYLKSVTLQENEENASEIWQYVFTKEELFHFLSSRDAFRGMEDGVESVEITETDPYGSDYVTLLSVTDSNDNLFLVETSEKVRKALRFDSANFKVSYTMEADVVGEDGTVSRQTVSGYIDADGEYRTFDSFAEYPLAGEPVGGTTVGADHITFDGVGSGHGVGFSGVGAEQLVAEGYSYRYLIEFYFEGTKISKLP